MLKKFGDFHNLRLINFDSGDTKENIVYEGESRKPGHSYTQKFKKNLNCSTNGFIGKCSKWMKTQSSSETSFRPSFLPTGGSSRNNGIRYIFKRQSNHLKRPITKRSVSLYTLKQNFSSTSFSITNPIRRSLKTVTEKSLKRKQDKYGHCNKTDVQVLFMSETLKADRRLEKSNISEDKRKLDWINNSKSSNLFNYKSKQNHSNKKYHLHKNNNRHFKFLNNNYQNVCKFKECKENNTGAVRNNDSTNYLSSQPCGKTLHMCSNLGCAAPKIEETPYNECIHNISTIDFAPCLDKQVCVKPTFRDICMNYSLESDNPKIINTGRTRNVRPCTDQIKLPLCTPCLNNSPESLAKVALKYFLTIIAIIVWSPCILLICIYWVATYPARPLPNVEMSNLSKGSMIGSYDGHGRNFCQRILHLLKNVYGKVTSSYNTTFSLVQKQKRQESQHLETCVFKSSSKKNCIIKTKQNWCPNPKNIYILYYTRHRGWIMKPLKKHRRSINKRREYNIEDFPSSKEKSEKKVIRNQSGECFPEKLKDKIKFKTIESVSSQPSQKGHPNVSKVVSPKTLPVSNVNDGLPSKIGCTDATTMPPPDLISNKDCHPEPAEYRQMKPRKNVSFEGKEPEPLDLSDPRNPQIISPRLNIESFFSKTLRQECIQSEPLKKIIKRRPPCQCQQIRRIPTRMGSKKQIPERIQNPIRTKNINIKIGETAPRLNIKPNLSYHKYQSREKTLPKKNDVKCLCKSVRKNVIEVIQDVEYKIWKHNCCNDMYIHTLRRKPCFWIYKRCHSFYPYFLIFYKFYENVVIGILFIISTCICVPIFCCCYICFSLFCRCTKC